ncbi:VOC family protein [Nocardiopsis sp. CNT312]|uniref:VOC family protein n=1 Tax=Nocardiopsis sp. CNT312 TaxID=1137268 RepID=UPI00048BC571|nr:VOC family protein [Nocardiopsis sp. CNT312]
MVTVTSITPFLWFDDQAEEAARLYTGLFDGSRILGTTRSGPEERVLTVEFELSGQRAVALNGGPAFTFTEAFSFQVLCEGQKEVDALWEALTADGGREDRCGWLKDRFGLSWQIVPAQLMELLSDPDSGRAQRATQAMMGMQRIDVAELRRAADAG